MAKQLDIQLGQRSEDTVATTVGSISPTSIRLVVEDNITSGDLRDYAERLLIYADTNRKDLFGA